MPGALKLITIVALALLAALASAQAFTPAANAAFTDSDGDGINDILEEVLGSDPSDVGSTLEGLDALVFLTEPSALASCSDGLDNDGDGLTDASDGGCIDSDGDELSDTTELALGTNPNNDEDFPEDSRLVAVLSDTPYAVLFSAYCLDGEDNDLDGLVDADDPGCAPLDADGDGFEDGLEKTLGSDWEDASSEPEHITVNEGSCDDALDNDGDALTDAADLGCITAPNDDFSDALVIDELPFTHTAKIANATTELGERVSSCSGFFGEDEILRGTFWYEFTAPSDMHLLVDASETDILTSISVWRFGDTFGLAEVDCVSSFFYFGLPARLAFEATAGETYFIQVERLTSILPLDELGITDLGRLSFRADATAPPPNDDFEDAAPIPSLPFDASVDTIAASLQAFEPESTCQDYYPANSVWYRYTPASDTYIHASMFLGTDFGATIGVYQGASLGALEQVACGSPELAFHARAGQTYYFQASGYTCQSPSEGGEAASFCLDSPAGNLELHVEEFMMPSCPAPQFSLSDPVGDQYINNVVADNPDIVEVTSAFSQENLCISARLSDAVDTSDLFITLGIDADGTSGSGGFNNSCGGRPSGIDTDARLYAQAETGLLAEFYAYDEPATETPGERAYGIVGPTEVLIIIPLANIGADDTLAFTLYAYGAAYNPDCAPDGGHIACEDGACAFVPFRNGDANCATGTNAIDAAIVLQHSAGLLPAVPCPDAADVDGNAVIDSRDAALILQFGAGLIDRLPPPDDPCDPPFCIPIR